MDPHQKGLHVTRVGVLANLLLSGLKLATGILGQSQALIADAVHSLSDLITDGVVLAGLWFGAKKPDHDHHFGHGRLETLATAIVGLILLGVAGGLAFRAFDGLTEPAATTPTAWALVGAAISILVKEGLYRYTAKVGKEIHSRIVLANAWHHRSDALSSVAVLVGVAGTLINPSWILLDAFAALLVAFMIAKVGGEVVWKALLEISDAAPEPELAQSIRDISAKVDGVKGTCEPRARLVGGAVYVQLCVRLDPNLTIAQGQKILDEVQSRLEAEIDDLAEIVLMMAPENPP